MFRRWVRNHADLPAASAGIFELEPQPVDRPHRAMRHRALLGLGGQHGGPQGPRTKARHRKVSRTML